MTQQTIKIQVTHAELEVIILSLKAAGYEYLDRVKPAIGDVLPPSINTIGILIKKYEPLLSNLTEVKH